MNEGIVRRVHFPLGNDAHIHSSQYWLEKIVEELTDGMENIQRATYQEQGRQTHDHLP